MQSKSIFSKKLQIIEEANRVIGMQIPSELDAIIQFEGRDDNETKKLKTQSKSGLRVWKFSKKLTQAYVLTKEKNI